MSEREAGTTWRQDYRVPEWLVEHVDLHLDIGDLTRVRSRLQVRRNPDSEPATRMWLDGRQLKLLGLEVDGTPIPSEALDVRDDGLWLEPGAEAFELLVITEINPDSNDSMEGLYRSGKMLCTQCEARGFSRISYFPDRPDIMSTWHVRLEAEPQRYPLLLSNGNPGARGTLGSGPNARHFAEWDDPFRKPCYLFAAVAGDLARLSDSHQTVSGRRIDIDFYVDHGDEALATHAIASLKQAMAWDEQVYGLECDLDLYQVVAARDFNMGAMENKGLNLFNSRYVLASDETATDRDRELVRAVIAHEYFHNWTGNRVTCRDWFQLSLKEGLTVFREQQFCEDMGSASVERIRQVRTLRELQFAEDAGPRAHAVRPESYREINNFYTLTVYEKGAELIRMMQLIAGPAGFNQGVRDYLARHDGTAATIEDLVAAIEQAANTDLSGIMNWYARAGTPVVRVTEHCTDAAYELRLDRVNGSEEAGELPMIPVRLRLHSLASGKTELPAEQLLQLSAESASLQQAGSADTLAAVGLGFSAPVRFECERSPQRWAALLQRETDAVVRFDCVRALQRGAYLEALAGVAGEWSEHWLDSLVALDGLADSDPGLLAELLAIPDASALSLEDELVDPVATESARTHLCALLASRCGDLLLQWFQAPTEGHDARAVALRSLAATAMNLCARSEADGVAEALLRNAQQNRNMSLRMAGLSALAQRGGPLFETAMADLFKVAERYPLVMDKWFSLRATASGVGVAEIRTLLEHPQFDWRNPNRVRSVLASYTRANVAGFHGDTAAYAFLADKLAAMDQSNPQLAARLVDALANWRRHAPAYALPMRAALEALQTRASSADLNEILGQCLSVRA